MDDGPPFPSSIHTASHGTKLARLPDGGANSLPNKELKKLDTTKELTATTDPSLQRTTNVDALARLADTLESEMSKEGRSSIGDRMHQLERIINAVQTMLEEPEKVGNDPSAEGPAQSGKSQQRKSIVTLLERPLNQIRAQILIAPTGTPQTFRPLSTTPHSTPAFNRPQTLAPHVSIRRRFPFRESNEQPAWDNQQNQWEENLGYQQPEEHVHTLHSSIRNRLFAPFNARTQWTDEHHQPDNSEFNIDPEVGILKGLGSVYSSLFNIMTQLEGDYDDGLSLKRH